MSDLIPETDEFDIYAEPDRIPPEKIVAACILTACACVGLGVVGHALKLW